jgi:hypothetical protein
VFKLEGVEPIKLIVEGARFLNFRDKEIIFQWKTQVIWLLNGTGSRPYTLRVARRDFTSGEM